MKPTLPSALAAEKPLHVKVCRRIAALVVFCCLNAGFIQAQTMKERTLVVKEIPSKRKVSLSRVSKLLEKHAPLQQVDLLNWEEFTYRPKVSFRIARSGNQIWLKYYVEEKHILAQKTETNSGVSRDSCVEFFFDPLADGNYYNFEFNCIGTVHLAYGPGRGKRQFIDKELIENLIRISSSLGSEPFEEKTGAFSWEMTIVIPAEILTQNPDLPLKGLQARANFYKCADDTQERHYLSWNPVDTTRPDYHRPEFFGSLVFE